MSKIDAADYVKATGGRPEALDAAWETADPMNRVVDRKRQDVQAARAAVEAALVALGADQTTRQERGRVQRDLAAAVPSLAWLLLLHPAEWSSACNAMSAAGGFGEAVKSLKKAVADTAKMHRAEVEAEHRRDQEQRKQERRMVAGADPQVDDMLSKEARGRNKATYANLVTVLRQDERWSTLRMSTLGDVVEFGGKEYQEGSGTADAAEWMRNHYGIDANETTLKAAIYDVAQGRRYSPVCQYLDSVRGKGSGTATIDRITVDILGIPFDPASEVRSAMRCEMVQKFLIGAVARAREPGCKLDTALVLVGRQGAKKSTLYQRLFGEWFGDSPIPIGNKDAPIQMSRVWGYEASEMEDLSSKRSAEAVKQFMSTRRDLYRAPFARTAAMHPRHTCLSGTTNRPKFLTDETGNRRFHILTIPDAWVIPVEKLDRMRDAVWAEAQELYEAREPWWFERQADEFWQDEAVEYAEEDDWQEDVERWIHGDGMGRRSNFTSAAVLTGALKLEAAQRNRVAAGRVRAILTRLGFEELASPAGFRGLRIWRERDAEK